VTKKFVGEKGVIKKLVCEKSGKEFELEADMVILAMGFLHPERSGLVEGLGLQLDERGRVKTDENYMTSKKGVFSAGDMRRGQSLVVWAIHEGRAAAASIDKYLNNEVTE
jgi:glutamate synthase (NADPH) small chain